MHVLGVVFGPLCSPVYIETLISGFWLEGGPGQGQSLPFCCIVYRVLCGSCISVSLSHHMFNRAVAPLVCRLPPKRTGGQRAKDHSFMGRAALSAYVSAGPRHL